MARSTARKRALNTLYEADEKGQDILSLLSERLENPGAQTPLPDYAVEIVRGVAHHRHHIDSVLNDHSDTWKVRRMPVVDRNILRIGVWELVYNDEIPQGVAIDEAIQLAKKLSDYDAPAFLHGVLSAVADDPEVTAEPEVSETAETSEVSEAAETSEATENSEISGVPEASETSEVPEASEAPKTSEVPAVPETSTVSETSGDAGSSAASEITEDDSHAEKESADEAQDLDDLDLSQFAVPTEDASE